jgi:hypothetical protein
VRKTIYVGDVTPDAFVLASHYIGSDPVRCEAVIGHSVVGPCCILQSALNREFHPRLKLESSGDVQPVVRDGQLVGKWHVGNHYHDKLVFVPKDATSSRTITAQAGVNLEMQYAVAEIFRQALRIWGIDLSSQTANQVAAFGCYRPTDPPEDESGDATLDLTNASNRNSTVAVVRLFDGGSASRQILRMMNSLRSYSWVDPVSRRNHAYNMFSAMGNGFTFELETLIFASIARACAGVDAHRVKVFGDDIIVPKRCVPLVTRCLAAIGHEVNARKSYCDGLFYESCGKHYFEGTDVTPVYQTTDPRSPLERIRAHNRLIRFAYRMSFGWRGECVARHEDVPGIGGVGLARWVYPACKTYFTDALGDESLKSVPLMPLAGIPTSKPATPAIIPGVSKVWRGSWGAEIAVVNSAQSELYEGDNGFAVPLHVVGSQGTTPVRTSRASGVITTTGISEISPKPNWLDRPIWWDLPAYAVWLKYPSRGTIAWERIEQVVTFTRCKYFNGWAEGVWLDV